MLWLLRRAVLVYAVGVILTAASLMLYHALKPSFPVGAPTRIIMVALVAAAAATVLGTLASARIATRDSLPKPTLREVLGRSAPAHPESRIVVWSRLAWLGWAVTIALVLTAALLLRLGLI